MLFGAAPWAVTYIVTSPAQLFPCMWALAILCWLFLRFDPTFDRRGLWKWRLPGHEWARIGGLLVFGVAMLLGLLWLYEPDRLFLMARRRPDILLRIALLYPLLSVWPQEIAFRVFFFHRYAPLFHAELWPRGSSEEHSDIPAWRPGLFLAVNAICFGWAHIVMYNALAVGLSMLGGVLFAWTYWRTRSLAAVCVEHACYGVWIFAVGWGMYFFSGARFMD